MDNKERKFIETFTGLQRAFGTANLTKLSIDPSTGKARPVYGWSYNEITEKDYLDHCDDYIDDIKNRYLS